MPQNCCTHQVWTVSRSPEPVWVTLGMGKNPTQPPKIYSFSPLEKSPLIGLNVSLTKVSFLPQKQKFLSNHPMQSSFVAAVVSVVSYFNFQTLCTHMSC